MEAWKTDVEPNHKVRSFRYVCERLVCDAENPQMRVHSVQLRDIFIRFVNRRSRKEAADELARAGRCWRRCTRDREHAE
jgi:hypothetical protein